MAVTSPLVTVWGRIESITGKDVLAAAQFDSDITHKVTIRYRDGILSKQQIYFQGPGSKPRAFQILYVLNPDERNKLLYLMCSEINDSAQQALTNEPSGLR